jgi:Cupin-like domain
MIEALPRIAERHGVTAEIFRDEIFPRAQPIVLRGLVDGWPSVAAAKASSQAIANYIRRFDRGVPAELIVGSPATRGRLFYTDDLRALNFERYMVPFGAALDRIFAQLDDPKAPALYMGASPVLENFTGFAAENRLDLISDRAVPRIWIGNDVIVTTHYDISDNIACVVAGRRRFTLFPPEQLTNLYAGPLEFTPAGPPVSMVSLEEPDLERYPRFKEALASAQTADLEPGDAIFIPYLWWHHVRSFGKFNVLVNYWWDEAKPWAGSPFEAMVHAILAIRDLPTERRRHWRRIFDLYIFEEPSKSAEHLPHEARGIQGEMTPAVADKIRSFLMHVLQMRGRG